MNWLYWVSAGSLVFSISFFLLKRYIDKKYQRELEEWREVQRLRELEVEMEHEQHIAMERHRRLEDLNRDYEEALKTEELMQELEREDNEKRSYTYSYRGSR